MDPILNAKIETTKRLLERSGFKDNYNCRVDKKTGKIVISEKKKKKEEER